MRASALTFHIVIYSMLLNSAKSCVDMTHIAKFVLEISSKSLSGVLQRIGSESGKQRLVFSTLVKRKEIIVYDTSALFSCSPKINMD